MYRSADGRKDGFIGDNRRSFFLRVTNILMNTIDPSEKETALDGLLVFQVWMRRLFL